jgi:phenylacetate-coenzyme A ligase PaaK-like adenylate-forming protein
VAAPWDHRSANEQRRTADQLVHTTLVHQALSHVPYVRHLLASAGVDARLIRKTEDLHRVPFSMRRDVLDPARNPEGPAGFILKGTAEGVKRFADRSVLYRVAAARLFGGEEVQELAIEAASRSVHLHLVNGPGGVLPISYTRDDLDLFARAGARLASLTGIDREDRLLNLVSFGPTLDFWGIFYMAHGVGMTALHSRREGGDLASAVSTSLEERPTVIALPAEEAPDFPDLALSAGMSLEGLRVVLAVGRSLTREERQRIGEALTRAGAPQARVAAAYGVAEGRVLWGECAVPAGTTETFGFHTYPDMELIEIVSPETGAPLGDETPGEIVVTPLGFRGGGAPRWRSGDMALGGVTHRPCPNCGRKVPRVGPSVRRDAWQQRVNLRGQRTRLDLREIGSTLAGFRDWQVQVAGDGTNELFIYVVPHADDPGQIIGVYETLERWGAPPTQIVLATPEELAAKHTSVEGLWRRFAGLG